MTPIDFIGSFQQAGDEDRLRVLQQQHAGKDHGVGPPVPLALTANASRVIFGVRVQNDQTTDTEIWTARRDGTDAHRIAVQKKSLIESAQWSPDANWIAIVTRPVVSNPSAAISGVTVVNARDGSMTVIVPSGATAPQWSADGQHLLFFRLDGDQWRPFSTESWSGLLHMEQVSDMTLRQPGAFSRDGSQVAGLDQSSIVVETLATHHRALYPTTSETASPMVYDLQALEWSWDDRWLYLATSPPFYFPVRPTSSFTLDLGSGKITALGPGLKSMTAKSAKEEVKVTAASWIPGLGHRLLLRAARRLVFSGDIALPPVDQNNFVPEVRWLFYDADSGKNGVVAGLEDFAGFHPAPPAFITWSLDSRFLVLGSFFSAQEYRYDRIVHP